MPINRSHRFVPSLRSLAGLIAALALAQPVRADGIYRNGIGARAMGLGGADAAWAIDPLGAMTANPAGLGFLTALEADASLAGAISQGRFTKAPTSDGGLDRTPNGLPEAAFALPLGNGPVTLGFSTVPDAVLVADWNYADPPGGLTGKTTYGLAPEKSRILEMRSAAGLGVAINPRLSLGASLGLVYNENSLQAPYTFQTTPGLQGVKTLFNLHTSGFGWNGQIGLLYRPLTNLQFGLSYRSETRVPTTGTVTGDASAQFSLPPGSLPFRYDADLQNVFPQMVNAGASWQFHPQWRLTLQIDWINWGGAFNELPITLTQGSNPAINAATGSSSLRDTVPLNWHDEFIYRAGLEYQLTENLSLRTGYSYGKSPVPNETLTPLTAVINEHTLTAGLGFHWSRWQVDLAYQYDFPATRNVGASALVGGDYSNSTTTVDIHWLALTVGLKF